MYWSSCRFESVYKCIIHIPTPDTHHTHSLSTKQHLEGPKERAVELFLLTDMLAGDKRGMPLLRAQAALVIVRSFHRLPAVPSPSADDAASEAGAGAEEEEGEGERTIGREEVLRAALECLIDL